MYDVVIVGGGPAGLNAALMLGRARRRTLLCDSGRPRNSVSHSMHGLLSRDGADPADVRRVGREQLAQYDTVEVAEDEVIDALRADCGFSLVLKDRGRVAARRVLLATGMRDELPSIPGLTSLWGQGTYPCPYCDGWEVRDQPLVALGTGMPGALFAVLLSKWSPDVVLCTNGPAEIDGQTRALLGSRGVRVREDEIEGISAGDSGIEVAFATGEALPRRALFVHPTLRQPTELPGRLACTMTEDGAIQVSAFGQASAPGIFAAGDAARPEGLPFPAAQVVIAAAQGATTAIALDRELLLEDIGLPASALA